MATPTARSAVAAVLAVALVALAFALRLRLLVIGGYVSHHRAGMADNQ